jgi:hypothetical protein
LPLTLTPPPPLSPPPPPLPEKTGADAALHREAVDADRDASAADVNSACDARSADGGGATAR